jgi:hypothetical protein
MKTKILTLIIVLCLACGVLFAQSPLSQNTPFKDWYKNTSIGTTYVTKSMWDLIPDMKIGNMTVADLQDMLDQVEIYYTSRERLGLSPDAFIHNAIEVAENNNYELIMQLSNEIEQTAPKIDLRSNALDQKPVGSKQVIFYAKKDKENEYMFKDLILINTEITSPMGGKCTVIRLLGNFTIDDIQGLIAIPASSK